MSGRHGTTGFSLLELLMALAIATLLVSGLLTVVQAAGASFRLQQGLGQMQEDARFVLATLAAEIEPAGYSPTPWVAATRLPAIAAGTADAVDAGGDRLVLRRWSDRNCHANSNPVRDDQGRPAFFVLEHTFRVRPGAGLAQTCRYGPQAGPMVTQVNNLGLAEGIESLQILLAEDTDGDGNANRWIRAGQWQDESRVMGVRLGLLLASPFVVEGARPGPLQVLDALHVPAEDGRLRRVVSTAVALRGRGG